VLALHFMQKAALVSNRKVKGISLQALQALDEYSWPGNIRQLEWAMERAVLLGETEKIELADLPPEILQPVAQMASGSSAFQRTATAAAGDEPVITEGSWEEHEKAKIQEALQRTNGNITRAAQLLGMTFRTLQYRLEKFGIKRV
ncbi:MAG: helix-turn-helix domain-containing protein, partial [Terriglobia bacterium]